MANIDFFVKNGLQVRSNVVVGTYVDSVTAPVDGLIISGSVGIGTSSPLGKLTVSNGNLYVNTLGFGIVYPDGSFQNTADLTMPAGTTGALQYKTSTGTFGGNVSVLYVDSETGFVGLGTTLPTSKITIENGDLELITLGNGIYFPDGSYQTSAASTTPSAGLEGAVQYANSTGGFDGDVSKLYIDTTTWNVGIGTSIPDSKLVVNDGNLKVAASGYGIVFPDGSFQTSASAGSSATGGTGAIQYSNSSGAFVGNSNVFYFDSSTYRVGIGTNSVSTSGLHVVLDAPTLLNTRNSGDAQVIIGNSATTGITLGQSNSGLFGYLRQANSGTNIISWTETGVGIKGITAPTNALDVAGAAVIGGGIAYAGSATAPSNGLLVQGSVGIGTISPATKFHVYGDARITSTTSSTSTSTGAITTTGGIGVAENITLGGNVKITNSNQGVVFSDGSFQTTAFNSTSAVTSFSAGSTGLTPSTGTAGAVTLAGTLNLTSGGTNASLTASNGGIIYSTATAMAVLSASATSGNVLLSGGAGAPSWGYSYSSSNVANSIVSRDSNGNIAVGTVTAGTWNGSTVGVAFGGTGLTSGTSGGVLYYSASGTLASSGALAANSIVIGGGAGSAPSTITTGTGVVTALGVNTGTAGAFVVNGGALGIPSSGNLINCTNLPLSTGTTGTLPVSNGGTGLTTLTTNGVLYGNGNSAVQITSQGGTNTVLVANGSAPSFSSTPTVTSLNATGNITAGAGLVVSAGGATITGASTVTGNLSVTGNIFVSGTVYRTDSNVIVVDDPLIYLANTNPDNIWDLGIIAAYNTGVHTHTGFARNYIDGVWTVFDGITSEPYSNQINWAAGNFGSFKAGNVNVAATTSSISSGTGSLLALGGAGIAGNLNVGGSNSYFTNNVGVGTSSGAGISSGNALAVFGNAVISGTAYFNTVVSNTFNQTYTQDTTSSYTSASTASQTIDSFPTATFRGAEYQICMTSSTSYEMARVTAIHDDTNGYVVEYANLPTASSLASFNASVTGGIFSLSAIPSNASTTFRISRKAFNV